MRRVLGLTAALACLTTFMGTANAAGPMSRTYAEDTNGIFWFMHVSDIHFDNQGGGNKGKFEYALGEVLKVVHPVYAFATGDLTNGTLIGVPTSGQEKAEWEAYRDACKKLSLTAATYFDIPGNHDAYDDDGLTYYLKYSVQGQATGVKFSEATHKTALGEYYFANLNSEGNRGKPFSFGSPEFTDLDRFEAGLQKHAGAQLVFVFSHHHLKPYGATGLQEALQLFGDDIPPKNVDAVAKMMEEQGAFYMHGHVHQYKEAMQGKILTNQIASLGYPATVDRSSDDRFEKTKYNSNIGIGVVDHNAFIYRTTDTEGTWPFVAITAPVDQYLQGGGTPSSSFAGKDFPGDYKAYATEKNPYSYEVCSTKTKSPIRALVLSKDEIKTVKLYVDGKETSSLSAAKDPVGIYAGTFDAAQVGTGLHEFRVKATTTKGERWDKITVKVSAEACGNIVDAGVDADGSTDASTAGDAEAGVADGAPEAASDGGADAGELGTDSAWVDGGALDAAYESGIQEEPEVVTDDGGGCGCKTSGGQGSGVGMLGLVGLAGMLVRRRSRKN